MLSFYWKVTYLWTCVCTLCVQLNELSQMEHTSVDGIPIKKQHRSAPRSPSPHTPFKSLTHLSNTNLDLTAQIHFACSYNLHKWNHTLCAILYLAYGIQHHASEKSSLRPRAGITTPPHCRTYSITGMDVPLQDSFYWWLQLGAIKNHVAKICTWNACLLADVCTVLFYQFALPPADYNSSGC